MADDVLGSLRVNVSADLSDLQSELDKIPSLVSESVSSISSAGAEINSEPFEAFAERMRTAGAEASSELEQIAESEKKAGEGAEEASPGLEHLGETALGAVEGFRKFLEELGLAVGAFEILKESLGAFSQAQDLVSSFTLLSGSAETASQTFDELREMSDKLAISTGDMLSVAQRIAPVFGVGTESATSVLRAAADASKAAGVSFETVALSLDRIQSSGQISSRQLLAMGISMDQVAETMTRMSGRTIDVAEAMDLLKKGAMSAADDTKVAIQTIEDNMGGAAEAISSNLSGQFQQLKNMMHEVALGIGDAIAPLASDVIATFREWEPTLLAIGDGAKVAAIGIEGLGTAVGEVVPNFVKLIFSAEGMISLGTAIGFTTQAAKLLIDEIHGLILVSTDFFSVMSGDITALGTLKRDMEDLSVTVAKDIQGFGAIADAGDAMALKLKTSAAMAKAAVGDILPSGDTFAGVGGPSGAPAPEHIDLTDHLLAEAEAKKVAKHATEDLHKADSDYAEFIKSTYVPSILTVEDAEKNVADARAVYESVARAESATRAQIAATDIKDTTTLSALEATFADQAAASQVAHAHYTEALKDQSLAKSTLATVTKDLDSAEAAIAAATRSTYIPTVLEHATALKNIADAEENQQIAINDVRSAQADLSAAYAAATKDANGNVVASTELKDAEDRLAASKVALTAATTKLQQAHKDETTSATLLTNITRALDQAEKDSIETKKKLAPAESDLTKAVGAYMQALKDVKDASDAEADAAHALKIAEDDQNATTQTQSDALARVKVAHDNVTVATKGLDVATQILTGDFKLSRDAIDELKRHTDDYTEAQKLSVAETSQLGIPSLEGLQRAAAQAQAAYDDLAKKGFANYNIALEANISNTQRQIDLAFQQGKSTIDLQLKLDGLTDALKRQRDGWVDIDVIATKVGGDIGATFKDIITGAGNLGGDFSNLAKDLLSVLDVNSWHAIRDVINKDLSTALKDILLDIDKVGADFKKLGEDILDVILNRIIALGIQKMLDLLAGVGGVLGSIGTALGGVAGGIAGAAGQVAALGTNTAAITANTAALTALAGTLSAATGVGAAGSAAGNAGGALGGIGQAIGAGLAPLMGIVTGAISAVTGVIGVFQNMHQETSLNAIESNTRVGALYTLAATQKLDELKDFNNASLFPELSGMSTVLYKIWDVLNSVSATLSEIFIDVADLDAHLQMLPQALQGVFQNVTGHVYLDGQELAASFVTYLTQSGIKMPQS